MTELEQRIGDIAGKFARSVVDALRNMTVDELGWLLRSPVAASTAGAATTRPVRKAKTTKPRPVAAAKAAAPRKLKLSPARKAALRIHGTYIGLVRGLPAAEKAKMKLLAKKNGMKAAVEAMKRGRK